MLHPYFYTLIPVVSVALLLFFSTALYGGHSLRSLALYCAAIGLWSADLFLFAFPVTEPVARQLTHIGTFVVATFIHVAYDQTGQKDYRLVWLGYSVALAITALGGVYPGMLYSPATLQAGPAFWPAMLAAWCAIALPLWRIAEAYPRAGALEKRRLRTLALAGVVGFVGAWANALLLSNGVRSPYPMLMVLASLFILTALVRDLQKAAGRRLLERSLLYAAMTALLSAGFLFGVFILMAPQDEPFLGQYRLSAFFLAFMAALAFEPLRQHVQQILGRKLLGTHLGSKQLAEALALQEERADHASRLAEVGRFVSAVAHEVRNPLGVIAAHVKVLELQGAEPDACASIREQLTRASTFVDDLLSYGRPRPLELRVIDLGATLQIARGDAQRGLDNTSSEVDWLGFDVIPPALVEGDQAQLIQVFLVLFENALLALAGAEQQRCHVEIQVLDERVCVAVEDSGSGVPEALRDRIFEPFVTGRKRQDHRTGTGLGLAIAANIVRRHQGTISLEKSTLGGARFLVELPKTQQILETKNESET